MKETKRLLAAIEDHPGRQRRKPSRPSPGGCGLDRGPGDQAFFDKRPRLAPPFQDEA